MNIAARQPRSLAIAVLATIALVAPAGAQIQVRPVSAEQIRIDNFAQVNAGYYRGAQPEGRDYADLAALGVKTVINLIGDDDLDATEQSLVEQHGMRYVHIPMDTHTPPTEAEIARFLSSVYGSESQPVYVHCVGGRHRTGVMTAVYRMTKDGLTGKQAFKEMKQFKYGWDFLHPEFKEFVHEFEASASIATAATTAAAATAQQQQQ